MNGSSQFLLSRLTCRWCRRRWYRCSTQWCKWRHQWSLSGGNRSSLNLWKLPNISLRIGNNVKHTKYQLSIWNSTKQTNYLNKIGNRVKCTNINLASKTVWSILIWNSTRIGVKHTKYQPNIGNSPKHANIYLASETV